MRERHRRERGPHAREGDVHDRHVEEAHERRRRRHGEDLPFPRHLESEPPVACVKQGAYHSHLRQASKSRYACSMLKRDYEGQNCSIARALELVGERWTLLIVRDAFLGLRRFDQFQDSLGIASNVLTSRLDRLVEAGVFERVRYQERPDRYEYRLTERGRALRTPLLALMQWGDGIGGKPPRLARRKSDGPPVTAALVGADGKRVDPGEIEVVPGPGATRPGRQRVSPTR